MSMKLIQTNKSSSHRGNEPSISEDHLDVLSHELRTPLSVISGYLQIIESELPESAQTLLQPVQEAATRLEAVIGQYLRYQEQAIGINPQNCNLLNVIEDIRNNFSEQANEKGIEINVSVSASTVPCYVDSNLVVDVLQSLMENAVKFSDGGMITVSCVFSASMLTVAILDEGVGLPVDQDDLFMPFVQGSRGLNRTHQGLGLGLSNAKAAAQRMGGTITLSRRDQGGTEARFSFPRFASVSHQKAA